MKRKSALIIAILIMSIGFAAISTTLIINGSTTVSENVDDFSVIFTAASLDGTDVYADVISQDKKTITFETNDLKKLNQKSILTYEVTNNSSNYDAEVKVTCVPKTGTTTKYTSIKNELENNATVVKAKETLNGTLTVTLNKTATEEVREWYVCELTFNATERDTLGENYSGPTEWTFEYTGGEQTFIVPVDGDYKLETWGAQGGYAYSTIWNGGYGAYAIGITNMHKNDSIYINIGGSGQNRESLSGGTILKGGYNGGGDSPGRKDIYSASGGGATHIATKSGLLASLENNINQILIVSGAGGGGTYYNGIRKGIAGNAGGIVGNSGTYENPRDCESYGTGGTQSSGGTVVVASVDLYYSKWNDMSDGSFGRGSNGNGHQVSDYILVGGSGGGSGFYGGSGNSCIGGAGGGSSYIGNSLLTEKAMYCYNCQESTEETTKTISTTCVSETPTENCAKSGNGYARITLIQ